MTTSATARSSPGGLGSAASSVNRSTTSEAIARSYLGLLGGGRADGRPLTRARECGTDEIAEQRRRTRGPRLELRMELACHEPRVIGQFDDLDEPALLERARDDQPALHERRAVMVVDLVTMPVALVHDRLAVGVVRAGSLAQRYGLRAEPHRAAEILDLFLLGQQVDYRVRRLGIHLGRVRAVEAEHVTGELGDSHGHSGADPKVRDLALARNAAGQDLSFP